MLVYHSKLWYTRSVCQCKTDVTSSVFSYASSDFPGIIRYREHILTMWLGRGKEKGIYIY